MDGIPDPIYHIGGTPVGAFSNVRSLTEGTVLSPSGNKTINGSVDSSGDAPPDVRYDPNLETAVATALSANQHDSGICA
mgnify:CR=1 FL=1